ncbi:MAG: hypothetical protein HZB83_03715 [Deltaproteobacteria bacterium]|nr:hypothetical protein [Deltaproteobacteria bacterium]
MHKRLIITATAASFIAASLALLTALTAVFFPAYKPVAILSSLTFFLTLFTGAFVIRRILMPLVEAGRRVKDIPRMERDIEEIKRLKEELERARKEAENNSARLRETLDEMEEFALLAVRREVKMREIRERFKKLKNGLAVSSPTM